MLVSCQPEWLCNIILQSNNPSTLSRPERKREFLSTDITCKDTDTWKNPWTCTRITHINSLRTHLRPEAVIWRSNVPFHLEISGCNHDVRNGRQSDRRSRTHLQADIKQRHVCVCTDRWTLMMKTCWVLSVFHLLSSSVYPVHQIVSTLTLLFKVHFQLSNPLLQSEAVTSLWRVCFAITALCKSSYKIVRN